ncbi:6938_t:CDS:1, partial [Cetraspora pellucida]
MDNQKVKSSTQRKREYRKNETDEQRERRLIKDRERKREKRAAETPEKRETRLAKDRNRYQKRQKKESITENNNFEQIYQLHTSNI